MNLQSIDASAASPEVPSNENFETLDALAVYGKRQPVTTGLTWGYYGGRWGGYSVAAGTLTLTDNATNYAVVHRTDGAISVSTATTNWNDTSNYARVYKIVAASGVVSGTPEDHRAGQYGIFSASQVNFADAEVPTGSINSSNAVFTLAHAPSPAASLLLVLNGITQKGGGVDYTLSSLTITYVTAPPTGASHECWYRY